jgi:hypothetical protein
MVNQSPYPFTSGPVLLLNDNDGNINAVGQDLIVYTPKNGQSSIKLNETNEVKVSQFENELEIKQNGKSSNDNYYERTIKATIVMNNYKDKAVTMCVKRKIAGALLESSIPWQSKEISALNYKHSSLNMDHEVSWDTTLKPMETKKIEYTYKIYFSR